MKIKIAPFIVPNFVVQEFPIGLRQSGFKPHNSYPLADVDAHELSAMCDAFRATVFEKAKKNDPAKEGAK